MGVSVRPAVRVLCVLFASVVCVAAQGAEHPKDASAAKWQAVARWPNFMGGMWKSTLDSLTSFNNLPSLRPEFLETAKAARKAAAEGKGQNRGAMCQPLGVVGILNLGFAAEFFYSRDVIFMMTDTDEFEVRAIYVDGRGHDDPDPTPNGHSIGHWEGDTLVVDTVAIAPETEVSVGVPIGEGAHLTERFRLKEPDVLEVEAHLESPASLTKPWDIKKKYYRTRDWHVDPSVRCNQNNRLSEDASGVHVDLTVPK